MLCIPLKYFCIVFDIRTSQNRKVPSFGATNQSSKRQKVSSSSSATKAEGTQTDVEGNRPSTSEANNRQEGVNEDCSDINVQDISVQATDGQEIQEEEEDLQATDGQENQEEEEYQGDVNVVMNEDVNMMENYVDGEPSYQVRSKRDDTAIKCDITAG